MINNVIMILYSIFKFLSSPFQQNLEQFWNSEQLSNNVKAMNEPIEILQKLIYHNKSKTTIDQNINEISRRFDILTRIINDALNSNNINIKQDFINFITTSKGNQISEELKMQMLLFESILIKYYKTDI